MPRSARWVYGLLLLLGCAAPADAAAQPRLTWSPDWARAHEATYGVTPVVLGGSIAVDLLYEGEPEALSIGPVLFDRDLRAQLRDNDEEDRERAATLSDLLLLALVSWPLVDSLFVVGAGDQNSDVMWQLSWIALEAAAADYLASTAVKLIVRRERPHGEGCTVEDRTLNVLRCGTRGRTRSFYSGHASASFSSAGVICMSHANLPIYGSIAGDTMACGVAMLTASVVAVLRVIADRHYATDVLVGAVMGLFTGLVLPYVLHYGWDPDGTPTMRTDPLSAAPLLSFSQSF